MNQCFDFSYKGLKVKAIHDSESRIEKIDDITADVGGVEFKLADFAMTEKLDELVTNLEHEASKVYLSEKSGGTNG